MTATVAGLFTRLADSHELGYVYYPITRADLPAARELKSQGLIAIEKPESLKGLVCGTLTRAGKRRAAGRRRKL